MTHKKARALVEMAFSFSSHVHILIMRPQSVVVSPFYLLCLKVCKDCIKRYFRKI